MHTRCSDVHYCFGTRNNPIVSTVWIYAMLNSLKFNSSTAFQYLSTFEPHLSVPPQSSSFGGHHSKVASPARSRTTKFQLGSVFQLFVVPSYAYKRTKITPYEYSVDLDGERKIADLDNCNIQLILSVCMFLYIVFLFVGSNHRLAHIFCWVAYLAEIECWDVLKKCVPGRPPVYY